MTISSGTKVALDLVELKRLCEQCMTAIDEQQDKEIQGAMRTVCNSCMQVRERLPELHSLRQRAGHWAGSRKVCV